MIKIFTTLALIAGASTALAHSKVNTTTPTNDAVIAEVPSVVGLQFAKKIRLIKVEMTHLDHPTVQLDLGDQKSFATEFSVPVIAMGGGKYVIEWRGLGIDGHAMNGQFMFVVE